MLNYQTPFSKLLAVLLASLISYQPVLADNGYDISQSIPDIGSSADTVLSLNEEQKLGEAFMRNTRGSGALIEDPELESYIQNLGQRLVSYLDYIPYDFTFFIVNDANINAFAVPGGYIGINAGLIMAAENENELASVMAHEIAHISQRHISRSFEKSQDVSLLTMASIFAAILLANQDGQASMAALSTGMAASYQSQLNFTRTHEKEADRVGIQLLASAGYDPRGMPRFFEKLHQETRYMTSGVPEILLTHPVTTNRISDARGRAENYPHRGEVDHPIFQLMKNKIAALNTRRPHQLEKEYQSLMEKEPAAAIEYGYAEILMRNGKHAEAAKILTQLIKQDQKRPSYLLAFAQTSAVTGDVETALDTLKQGLALYPGNKALISSYTDILIRSGNAKKGADILDTYMRHNRSTPDIYQLRAKAEDAIGNHGESRAALAEVAFLRGQTALAIQHLEAAKKAFKDNKLRLPAIESRLEEIKKIALEERDN